MDPWLPVVLACVLALIGFPVYGLGELIILDVRTRRYTEASMLGTSVIFLVGAGGFIVWEIVQQTIA